jgi:RimJ/RimL family protein N-acetyltransferase
VTAAAVAAARAASARSRAPSSTVGGVQLPTRLTDGVVVLRQLEEGDRAEVLRTMRDPLVRRWLNMPTEPGDADFDRLRRRVVEGYRSGDRYDYVVTEASADTALGAVVASRRHRENYELAYLAGQTGRGRGLMSRAIRVLSGALFAQGVGRLELRTHPANDASQRLASRAGFVREGLERRSIWLHGRREDAILWSLLPDDLRHGTTIEPCRTGS